MDLRAPASFIPGFHFSLIKGWTWGKSCSCLEEQIDLHSNKQWTQPRDKNCTPGFGKGLGTALNLVRDQDLGAAPVPPVLYLPHTPH